VAHGAVVSSGCRGSVTPLGRRGQMAARRARWLLTDAPVGVGAAAGVVPWLGWRPAVADLLAAQPVPWYGWSYLHAHETTPARHPQKDWQRLPGGLSRSAWAQTCAQREWPGR